MTASAYQTLYESAVAFGMRKALQTEQGKSEMEARMQVRLATIVSSKFNQTLLGYVDPVSVVFCVIEMRISVSAYQTLYFCIRHA